MSNVYGYSAELSMGNTANDGINALNRNIREQNVISREKHQNRIKGLQQTFNNANPKIDKIGEAADATIDSTYALGGGIKGAYRASQMRADTPMPEEVSNPLSTGEEDFAQEASTGVKGVRQASRANIATAASRGYILSPNKGSEVKATVGEATNLTEAPEVAGESVIRNGISALDKGGVIASGLSKVSGVLTGVNILQGGYDAVSDLANPTGFSSKNLQQKKGNLAGIVSGGTDALALGVRQATKGAATAGAEALGEAAGLEEAGAAADATGIGALVGLGLGVAGAVVGAYGAYKSYEGDKTAQKAVGAKLTAAKNSPAPQEQQASQQDYGSSGAEVRSTSGGISAVS